MTRDWDVVVGEAMMALTVDCTCTNVVDWFSSTFLLTICNAWADTLDRYHFRNFKRLHAVGNNAWYCLSLDQDVSSCPVVVFNSST
jgi:hypothetical protein